MNEEKESEQWKKELEPWPEIRDAVAMMAVAMFKPIDYPDGREAMFMGGTEGYEFLRNGVKLSPGDLITRHDRLSFHICRSWFLTGIGNNPSDWNFGV